MTLPRMLLVAWGLYIAGVGASFYVYGASQPLYTFGFITAIGLVAGWRAVRGLTGWRLLAVLAAVAFLSLALWRHLTFAWPFMQGYGGPSAALNQYVLEHSGVLRRDIDQHAYLSLIMYAYHEWLMPLIQLLVVVLVTRTGWARSNFSIWTPPATQAEKRR